MNRPSWLDWWIYRLFKCRWLPIFAAQDDLRRIFLKCIAPEFPWERYPIGDLKGIAEHPDGFQLRRIFVLASLCGLTGMLVIVFLRIIL